MEIVAEIASSCLLWYPEAAVTTFDHESSTMERVFAGTIFAIGTAGLLAIAGFLAYIVIHGV